MASVGDLRATLVSKGYSQTASTASQNLSSDPITVHLHPLLQSPVILIGLDQDACLEYQQLAVDAAIARR